MMKTARNMKLLKRLSGIVIAMAALFCTPAMHAQTVTGNITGLVTDPSGAVVAGASVLAHNTDTGVDSTVTTNSAGLYRVQFLPIGRYEVTVVAKGFNKETIPAFQLEVLQTVTFNVKLTLGATSTVVNVSEAAPILNTNDATLSGTFTTNTIQNFPLNGLDFSALTLYVPGSVSTVGTSGTTSIERSLSYTDSVNLNGNRAQANNYTLDGIDLNETFNNLIAYSPAPESLQEIKVLTANSPADYGNVNGAGVVSILKSGTNTFHGSAYGYVQDHRLNANSWTNNHASPIIPINSFSQSQFGGTFGGPIKRDKLFFFVDYLGSRFHNGGTSQASVFTAAMRNGDFSALLTGSNPIQLYDPLNGFAPYVGNKGVPIVNPVAKYLFAHPDLYPLPNATPSDGIVNNNLQGPQRTFRANNQGDIKIEYTPNAVDKFSAFYSKSTADDGASSVLAISFPNGSIYPSQLGGLTWVHIFSPTIVNSARIGFTRINWNQGLPVDGTGQFGTNGNSIIGITFPNQAYQGFTFQGITGLSGVGNSAQNNGSLTDNTFSYIENLTVQHGKSTFSIGVQALRYQNNYPTSNNNGFLGSLNYSGAFTSNPSLSNAGGYGGADFLLDRVSGASATLASVNVGQRQWRASGFVNDDYKATPRLTLNAGLRYEYDQPWIESNNKTGNIDIATGQVIYAGSIPTGGPVGSGLCSNRACYQANYRQLMPRLGFAYQATDRFVIRGGYGATSFFEGNSSNQRLTSITPFIQAVNVTVVTPTPANPGVPRTAEQGFTGGTVTAGGTFNVYPQNIQPAYVQEFNLTAEYAVTHSLSLQVGYVGELGQHIEDYGNLNQYLVNGDPTSAPYYNNKYIGVNAIDPSVSIGSNNLLITESRATSNYQALQTVLRQRTTRGLEFTVNYTYGKALTNSAGNYSVNTSGASNFGQGAFQNYYDSAADWGPAAYDVRHNLSGTGVYALPVGHGKQYLSGVNRFVDEAIGGWKVEYCYDDWSIAHVARKLGKTDDAVMLAKRSTNYRNYFDASVGFMRPKLEDGSWASPFDPDMGHSKKWRDYTESNAWQTTFGVQHDVEGLIQLFGGREQFVAKLDDLFRAPSTLPADAPPDIAGLVGQYAHGNEPSHHIAYLYVYAGVPHKTQARVRSLLETMYSPEPDGMQGNEDVGQMSAWYILSALGFYPVDPVSGIYIVGSPLFEHATVELGGGKKLEIEVRRKDPAHQYVQAFSLSGKPQQRTWFHHGDIARGGKLVLEMGSEPNPSLGSDVTAAPPSLTL